MEVNENGRQSYLGNYSKVKPSSPCSEMSPWPVRRRRQRRVRSAICIGDLTVEAVNATGNSLETVEETKPAESAVLLFPLLASLPGLDVLLY